MDKPTKGPWLAICSSNHLFPSLNPKVNPSIYVLRYSTLNTPILDDGDDATVEKIKKMNKWENDDYVCRGIILNVICALRSLSRCMIVTSQSNNVVGPSVVNMIEHNNSIRYNDNKGKHKHQDIKVDPSKKSKVTCWKYEKPGYLKKYCKDGKIGNKANGSGTNDLVNGSSNLLKEDDDVAWWVDLGAIFHVCKDR
ncbi:hypothetical protein Tco_1047936 [Tanacetum coccineum]